MTKTLFLWLLIIGLLATGSPVDAQQSGKIPRIGYVSSTGDANTPDLPVQAFRQGLRDLGYIEGKNILIEYRSLEGKRDRIPTVMPSNFVLVPHLKKITDLAAKNRLASMHERSSDVDAGGLMSYATDEAESYTRAAWYVDKILKGAKPADLPVEQPTKFEFVINLKTANQIGVTIPQWTLMKADKVIK
jgi:ABC-type uncharacterized transport system substrate-binding protein